MGTKVFDMQTRKKPAIELNIERIFYVNIPLHLQYLALFKKFNKPSSISRNELQIYLHNSQRSKYPVPEE